MVMAFLNRHFVVGLVAILLVLSFLTMSWWYAASYAQKSAISYVQHESLMFQKKLFSKNARDGKALLPEHESLGFAAAMPEREIVLITKGVFRPSGKTITLWLSDRAKELEKLERHDQKLWWIDQQGHSKSGISSAQWLIFGTPIGEDQLLFVLYNLMGEKAFISHFFYLSSWFIPFMILGIITASWLVFRRFEQDIHQINQFLSSLHNTNSLKEDKSLGQGKSAELKQLSREINFMLKRLKMSVSSQEKAVQNFAHAFKTPLASAAQNLDMQNLTLKSVTLAEEAEKMRSMAEMSKSLCRIAQMGAEKQTITLLALSEPINNMIDFNDVSFEDKQIEVSRTLAACCQVQDVNDLTSQVISNLVSNALKYTKQGGRFHIKTQKTIQGWQLVMENSPCLAVNDVEKNQLGLPLFRAESVRKQEGYGLGLAFVKKSLDIMGGCSHFDVLEDRFRVTLVWPATDQRNNGKQDKRNQNNWTRIKCWEADVKKHILSGLKKIF